MLAGLGLLGLAWVARSSYRIATHDFEPWPGSAILKHPEEIGVAGLTPVSFVSGGGAKLAAWYVPSKNRAAVVLAHGTNADRSALLPELRILANAGFGVLAFDWPGDGESTGHIEWGQEEQDALRAALGWLTMQHDIDPQRIGGFGFSMGGYTLAQVAAQDQRLRAVVLAATPPDYVDYARWQVRRWGPISEGPVALLLRQFWPQSQQIQPQQAVARIAPRPVLILAGDADPVVPPFMAQRLFNDAAAPKALWLIPRAGHGGYASAGLIAYQQRLTAFFLQALLK
jgi:uncharacterized protein